MTELELHRKMYASLVGDIDIAIQKIGNRILKKDGSEYPPSEQDKKFLKSILEMLAAALLRTELMYMEADLPEEAEE